MDQDPVKTGLRQHVAQVSVATKGIRMTQNFKQIVAVGIMLLKFESFILIIGFLLKLETGYPIHIWVLWTILATSLATALMAIIGAVRYGKIQEPYSKNAITRMNMEAELGTTSTQKD